MEILLRPGQFYRRLLAEPFVAWGWVFFSGLVQAAAVMVYLSGPLAGNRALLAAGVAQAIVLPFTQLLQLGLAGLILGLFVGLDGQPFVILSHTYRLQALLGLVLLPSGAPGVWRRSQAGCSGGGGYSPPGPPLGALGSSELRRVGSRAC